MNIEINALLKCCIILLIGLTAYTQTFSQSPLQIGGYISEMPSFTYQSGSGNVLWDNLIHNRLKLSYSTNNNLKFRMEFRNRFFLGESVENSPLLKFFIDNDPGWADLSFNWGSGKSYLVNTIIDRLSVEKTWGKFQVRIGRQRVNWSQAQVWNPNDIFNSYSYFDFDYPERPGMDGVRFQFYTGASSRLEGVIKVDRDNEYTSALLYGFNFKGYDLQLITGQVTEDDLIFGIGWSGNVSGAGFYGEMSYLSPLKTRNSETYLISIGANYSFRNSLMLTSEYLYSSNLGSNFQDYNNLSFSNRSIKNLSVTDHSYMLSASMPINPLLNLSLSYVGFSYPFFENFYIGPNIEYSLKENLYLSFIAQLYYQKNYTVNQSALISFLRLKKVF